MNADRLKAIQAELGWTNKRLADRLNVHESTIEKWRAGKVKMSYAAEALIVILHSKNKPSNRKANRGSY